MCVCACDHVCMCACMCTCVSVCVMYVCVCVWKREGDKILVTCGICSNKTFFVLERVTLNTCIEPLISCQKTGKLGFPSIAQERMI